MPVPQKVAEVKPIVKPEVKPEIKPVETKHEAKPDLKPEVKKVEVPKPEFVAPKEQPKKEIVIQIPKKTASE